MMDVVRDTIHMVENVERPMRPQSSKPSYGGQPSQGTIRNSRQGVIDDSRKRFEGFNNFFNVK
jgi:hypothetical protein